MEPRQPLGHHQPSPRHALWPKHAANKCSAALYVCLSLILGGLRFRGFRDLLTGVGEKLGGMSRGASCLDG